MFLRRLRKWQSDDQQQCSQRHFSSQAGSKRLALCNQKLRRWLALIQG